MSNTRNKTNKLNKELDILLLEFDKSNRTTIKDKIENFEKECLEITKKVLPTLSVPIYMSIHKFDNNKQNSETTWDEWVNNKNIFANQNDNYCRDIYKNGTLVYPVMNPNTDETYFRSCSFYIDEEMKNISSLKYEISTLIGEARNAILKAETSKTSDKTRTILRIDNKIREYEQLQEQYIQLAKLLDNFTLLLKNKRDLVTSKNDKYDKIDNELNIKRDHEDEFNEQYHRLEERNKKFLTWGKILIFICWLLVLGLFSLININRVIT